MQHNFDIEIAKKYGILEAILLNNIFFWIEKNRANDVNCYDGIYWTYNSIKAFAELFPYATERKISYALKHLVDEEILVIGNYNKSAYDRTLWYAITDKGYSILQNEEIHLTKMQNGNVENVEPIPNINTDNINNSDDDTKKESELLENFELIWQIYPRKEEKNTAFTHYKSWLKGKKYAGKKVKLSNKQMWLAVNRYNNYIEDNKVERQFIKKGSNFFKETIMEYVE